MVMSTPPWTSLWILVVWKRWKLHLQNQRNIREDQERGGSPLWVLKPLEGQRKTTRQGTPLLMSVLRIFPRLLRNLIMWLVEDLWVSGTNTYLLTVISIYQDRLLSAWWSIRGALQERKISEQKIWWIAILVCKIFPICMSFL